MWSLIHPDDVKKTIKSYQKFIKENFKFVGENFAYEARSIHYNSKKNILNKDIRNQFKSINKKIVLTDSLKEFERCLATHELLISKLIGIEPIKNRLFKDYDQGVVKSLGAWGGDFVLVTGSKTAMNYFLNKGYKTIFEYSKVIK